MKLLLFLFSQLAVCATCISQVSEPFRQLNEYIKQTEGRLVDSSKLEMNIRADNKLNYLMPLYTAIQNEDRIKVAITNKRYYDDLSCYVSFTGDYKTALYLSLKGRDSLSKDIKNSVPEFVNTITNVKHEDAWRFILSKTKDKQVVMINEAYGKPQTRLFTLMMLGKLYAQGFRYLAMETLNSHAINRKNKPDMYTGYYTCEPVGGELIRMAQQTGFTLVAYEDTLSTYHTRAQSDSIEAINLHKVIQNDSSAKILVMAGYGHVSKKAFGNYIPMALAFKNISGIDPLTICQTDMTEGSDYEYGRLFYDLYTKKYPIQTPVVAFQNNSIFNPFEIEGYDVLVIQPPTIYKNGRPTWYSFYGLRKELPVKPTERRLFMVQAYYANEFEQYDINYAIPADQTYVSGDDGYYHLYLFPGNYKVVLRDIAYNIISMKDETVN